MPSPDQELEQYHLLLTASSLLPSSHLSTESDGMAQMGKSRAQLLAMEI